MSDLELKELNQFCGTQQYYKGFLNTNLTDGIAYIMNNGYTWFVNDAITVIKTELKNQAFLVVKLELLPDSKAKMIIDDGNGKILYTQNYDYTDAKRELKLFFTDNVLMLSSEY